MTRPGRCPKHQTIYRPCRDWLYPDGTRFARGLSGLLRGGEVRLVTVDGAELPEWEWRERKMYEEG